MIIYDTYCLTLRRSSHAAGQIYLDTGVLILRICEAEESAMVACRHFSLDAIILEEGTVIAGTGTFRSLVILRSPAFERTVLTARNCIHRTGNRHDEEVSELSEPSYSAHLDHREALYRTVFVAVTRTIVTSSDGLRACLDHTERNCRSREGLSQTMIYSCSSDACTCADHRIHISCRTCSFLEYICTEAH